MRRHRLALILSSSLLACQSGIAVTGDTGDISDTSAGTTTVGSTQDCGPDASSILIDGTCWCEPGTTWVEPFDPTSFECAPLEPRDGNTCPDYYAWCSENLEDTDCCYDPAQDPDGSHDPQPDTSTGDASTGDASTGDASTGETSTGDTDATSTGDTDATSTGTDASTGTEASTGDTSSSGAASTDGSGSSSDAGQ